MPSMLMNCSSETRVTRAFDRDRARDLVRPPDGVALGRQVGQLLTDAVSGQAARADGPGAGDGAIGRGWSRRAVRAGIGGGRGRLPRWRRRRKGQGSGAVAAQDLVIDDEPTDAHRDDGDDSEDDGAGLGHQDAPSGRDDPSRRLVPCHRTLRDA